MTRAEGFDKAIIGTTDNNGHRVIAYDIEKCLEVLMERDGMTREGAEEFFYFNVDGAYIGEETPIFIHITEEDDQGEPWAR